LRASVGLVVGAAVLIASAGGVREAPSDVSAEMASLAAGDPGVEGRATSAEASAVDKASPTVLSAPAEAPAEISSVVGLGDSVMAAGNCGCDGIVDAVADSLVASQGHDVARTNFGANGLTAAQLRAELASDQDLRSVVASADVVVVTIGANDLVPLVGEWSDESGCAADCFAPVVGADLTDVETLISDVRTINPGGRILVTGYWNVFEDGQNAPGEAYREFGDSVTRAFNTDLQDVCRRVEATYVDLYEPFKGAGDVDPTALLAGDADHPNAQGYAVITQAVLAAL